MRTATPAKGRKSEITRGRQKAYRKAARKPAGWMIESRLDDTPGIVPEVPLSRYVPDKRTRKITVRKLDVSDARIEAARDFAEGRPILLHDCGGTSSVPGLRCRIGPRSATWLYYRDTLDHGERQITSRTLGHFPDMTTAEARKASQVIAGQLSGGRFKPSRSKARKFKDAFADYLIFLRRQAEDNGKPPRWMQRVAGLGTSLILPKWGEWTLLEMSERRAEVAEWYNRIVKGRITSANHAVKVIRAVYVREARRDDSLPGDPTKLPSAALTMRREAWQKPNTAKPGMGPRDFRAWLKKWRTLPAIRRSYHLVGLLTGARPGELARTPWINLDTRTRTLTIGDSKAGHDIPIPVSAAICRALKIARDHADKSGLIFPGCEQAGHHEPTFLKSERGHSHRRTWKTVAMDCKIPDEMSALVLGHIPEGVSAKYAIRQMLLQGRAFRGYQRQVSRRMIEYLGKDPTR
jgi:integrase